MDRAGVGWPDVLASVGVAVTEHAVVAEEPGTDSWVSGNCRREKVTEPFAEGTVPSSDARDQRVAVHRVTKLVIDDVRGSASVASAVPGSQKVDRGSIGERVAASGLVDGRWQLVVIEWIGRIDVAEPLLDD